MTGYGTATSESGGWCVSVEARSVNHRGLDMRVYVPRELAWFEPAVAELVRQRVQRGRVEVRVEIERDPTTARGELKYIDEPRFRAVFQQLRKVATAEGMDHPKLSDVLAFRHLFERDDAGGVDPDNPALPTAVAEALDALVAARQVEGEGLTDDMLGHLDHLAERLEALGELIPEEQESFRSRLRERVQKAVGEFEVGDIDQDRLAQELAYYADKADVSEELQRAASHIDKLREIAGASAEVEAVGKTIDFYLQELIRETNTMGSKSASSRATDLVIDMKATVERMREQAANIE